MRTIKRLLIYALAAMVLGLLVVNCQPQEIIPDPQK